MEENANVNYEALSGSKQYNLTIRVTDDSPERESSSFDVTIKVIDVNETPYFTNLGKLEDMQMNMLTMIVQELNGQILMKEIILH